MNFFAVISESTAILAVLLCSFVCFVLGWWVSRPRWNRQDVPPENRGPNADSHYQTVIVDGEDYWFTDEQLAAARLRAAKLGRR